MLGITSALRVVAVVAVSAVSFMSAMLKARNGEVMANANPFFNSIPYNHETGDVNNMNMMYNNSRRFGYNQMPQPMCGPQPQFIQRPLSFGVASYQPSPQLQQALSQYGYPTPGFNGYAQPQQNPMAYSRRNIGYAAQPYIQQQFQQPYMPTYPQQAYGYCDQQMNNYGYNNWYQQYMPNDGTQSLYTNYRPMDTSYGYGYTDQPQQYPQQQVINPQVNCSYGYPMNDSDWYIGCMARKEYYGSNGYVGGYNGGYYGYDENMPSYPAQPQPQVDPRMVYQQQMAQQQMMAQQQQAMQNQMQQGRMPSMEELKRQEEMKKRDAYMQMMHQQSMGQRPMTMEQDLEMFKQQMMHQPQQVQRQPSNFEIKSFNPDNAWLNSNDWGSVPQSAPQPQHPQKPMGQVIPPPSQPVPHPQPQQPIDPPMNTPMDIPPAFTIDTPNGPVMPDTGMPAPPPPQPQQDIVVVKNPNKDQNAKDSGGIDIGVFLKQGMAGTNQYVGYPQARTITTYVG